MKSKAITIGIIISAIAFINAIDSVISPRYASAEALSKHINQYLEDKAIREVAAGKLRTDIAIIKTHLEWQSKTLKELKDTIDAREHLK